MFIPMASPLAHEKRMKRLRPDTVHMTPLRAPKRVVVEKICCRNSVEEEEEGELAVAATGNTPGCR